jgi:hypothetical protein
MGALPAAWAGASRFTRNIDLDYTIEYIGIDQENGMLRSTGENPALRLKFSHDISPFLIDFISVSFAAPKGKPLPLTLNFAGDDGLYSKAGEVKFLAADRKNRVPTLTNLHWLYSEGISEISLTPDKMAVGDVFSCEVGFEVLEE